MQLTSPGRHRPPQAPARRAARADGAVAGVAERCSFSELVYAHYGWRGGRSGGAEDRYRDVLKRFESAHGGVHSAYWCSYMESAVALTEKERRFPFRPRLTFHRETDWATKRSPQIADELHRLDELAIRARNVLSGVRQAICLHLVAASAAHLLSLADAAAAPDDPGKLQEALDLEKARIEKVQKYYEEAANGQAQIVYFAGMASAALLVSLLAGLALLLRHWTWETGIVALIAGALGGVVSVIQRITNESFHVDYDIGRPYAFFLGGLRPLIGGALALAVAYTFDGGILHLPTAHGSAHERHLALIVVSFLAGFSERWAQDTLTTAIPAGHSRAKPSH
jgi:hypothetical protein